MQSSSESGRVAYCLPIGITSSKTKCVRLRNRRSLQHPKQISARIVDSTGILDNSCVVHCLYSQLRCIRTIRKMFSCLRRDCLYSQLRCMFLSSSRLCRVFVETKCSRVFVEIVFIVCTRNSLCVASAKSRSDRRKSDGMGHVCSKQSKQ